MRNKESNHTSHTIHTNAEVRTQTHINQNAPLLSIRNLCASLRTSNTKPIHNIKDDKIQKLTAHNHTNQNHSEGKDSQIPHSFQLHNISMEIQAGQIMGLAGESGSGKSVLTRIIMGLEPNAHIHSGAMHFDGYNLLELQGKTTQNTRKIHTSTTPHLTMRHLLGRAITYIPQDPLSSLNPLHKVYKQIEEVLLIHGLFPDKARRREHILSVCEEVGLHDSLLSRYPHELSGGQRQRVAICLGLVARPKLILCDEPTSALDMSLGIQITELLRSIAKRMGMAVLFITHDLGLLRSLCDSSVIMQQGRIVEILKSSNTPQHDYTKQLFEAHFLEKKECKRVQTPVILQLQNFSVGVKKSNFLSKKFSIITKNVNLVLQEGKTLGIIGESGSGKSSLAQGILHLLDTRGVDICFNQQLSCDGRIDKGYLKEMRKKMQVVFQDSLSSLNPRLRVRDIVSEGLKLHKKSDEYSAQAIEKVFHTLSLERKLLDRYPSELSGGQRQRVAIARSMVLQPKILILDEPTSALDKFVQKSTLALLRTMQETYNVSYILITHDLGVVANLCDDVAVLHQGEVIEYGGMEDIMESPQHDHTKKMVDMYHRFYTHKSI